MHPAGSQSHKSRLNARRGSSHPQQPSKIEKKEIRAFSIWHTHMKQSQLSSMSELSAHFLWGYNYIGPLFTQMRERFYLSHWLSLFPPHHWDNWWNIFVLFPPSKWIWFLQPHLNSCKILNVSPHFTLMWNAFGVHITKHSQNHRIGQDWISFLSTFLLDRPKVFINNYSHCYNVHWGQWPWSATKIFAS